MNTLHRCLYKFNRKIIKNNKRKNRSRNQFMIYYATRSYGFNNSFTNQVRRMNSGNRLIFMEKLQPKTSRELIK